MKLTEHFSLEELTRSQTAARKNLDNTPSPEVVEELKKVALVLEVIRKDLRAPIVVSSGYRSPEVNKAVGGSKTSDHMLGMAADITCPSVSTIDLAERIAEDMDDYGVGQVIHEFGSWVHVSTKKPEKEINRVITIDQQGTRPGIHPARS